MFHPWPVARLPSWVNKGTLGWGWEAVSGTTDRDRYSPPNQLSPSAGEHHSLREAEAAPAPPGILAVVSGELPSILAVEE